MVLICVTNVDWKENQTPPYDGSYLNMVHFVLPARLFYSPAYLTLIIACGYNLKVVKKLSEFDKYINVTVSCLLYFISTITTQKIII